MKEYGVYLPINPETNKPVLLIPKRWIRKDTWINNKEYFYKFYPEVIIKDENVKIERSSVLDFNRNTTIL